MEYVKLNTLCEINIGKTPSRNKSIYWGSGNKWLAISDLKEKYIYKSKEEITDIAVEESNMKLVPKDTVIMSFKLSIGKVAILKEDMFTNEAIANFKIKDKSLITPEYLYYALKTLNFNNTDRAVMGATLNKSKLNDIKIPYCDIETQKKIVEVLDKTQELIDKRKEQIEALDELVKSRFIEMFGDPVSNPKGWRETNLGDLFVGDVDYRGKTPPKSAEGIPLISAANVKMGKVDLSNADYISEEDYKNWLKRGIPNYNDILITTEAPMGRVALYPKGLYQLSRRVIAFEPDKERLNPYFALYTISSESWQKRLYKKVRGSTVPRILKPDILSQQIQTPPIELQNEFEKFVNQVDKLKSQMETSLKELEDNFNSLMQKAFKGELF